MAEAILNEWKRRDPLLSDFKGFEKYLDRRLDEIGKGDAYKMLKSCFEICQEGGRYGGREAFARLVEYMGCRLGLTREVRLSAKTIRRLNEVYDFALLSSRRNDHLGKLFQEQGLANPHLGQLITPKSVADMMLQMLGVEECTLGQRVLDPCVGTGRFLIRALKYVKPGVLLYGIEIDRLLYRACLVQMVIYSHTPFFLLNADAFLVDARDPKVWLDANKW